MRNHRVTLVQLAPLCMRRTEARAFDVAIAKRPEMLATQIIEVRLVFSSSKPIMLIKEEVRTQMSLEELSPAVSRERSYPLCNGNRLRSNL